MRSRTVTPISNPQPVDYIRWGLDGIEHEATLTQPVHVAAYREELAGYVLATAPLSGPMGTSIMEVIDPTPLEFVPGKCYVSHAQQWQETEQKPADYEVDPWLYARCDSRGTQFAIIMPDTITPGSHTHFAMRQVGEYMVLAPSTHKDSNVSISDDVLRAIMLLDMCPDIITGKYLRFYPSDIDGTDAALYVPYRR